MALFWYSLGFQKVFKDTNCVVVFITYLYLETFFAELVVPVLLQELRMTLKGFEFNEQHPPFV
jgi:hypothetical protein